MLKKIFFASALLGFVVNYSFAQQSAGFAGVFARMGFGGRGMGIGNALTAVLSGDVVAYYNPAVASFAEQRVAATSFGLLSLDRHLNFLSYTQALAPSAGISFGIINAGVKDIEVRDSDGELSRIYSTSENQFFFSFSNKFSEKLSVGVSIKLFYYKLFENVSTTNVGVDFGALYGVTNEFVIGLVIQDIDSKYRWDTSPIFGQQGNITIDRFPLLRRIGASYRLPNNVGIIAVDFENSNRKTNIFRFGIEINPIELLTLRSGIDRLDASNKFVSSKPSFGFSVRKSLESFTPTVTYAYVFEPDAPSGINVISIAVTF